MKFRIYRKGTGSLKELPTLQGGPHRRAATAKAAPTQSTHTDAQGLRCLPQGRASRFCWFRFLARSVVATCTQAWWATFPSCAPGLPAGFSSSCRWTALLGPGCCRMGTQGSSHNQRTKAKLVRLLRKTGQNPSQTPPASLSLNSTQERKARPMPLHGKALGRPSTVPTPTVSTVART